MKNTCMQHRFFYTPANIIIVLLSVTSNMVMAGPQPSKADPKNIQQVQRGELIYKRFCSLCHGRNLEGQPNWHIPKADGKMPAPPHDKTGHTWHHADIVLFNITKHGLAPPHAPKGYQSDMPGWKDTLSDDDIWAVLAYIKSRWPEENLQFQIEANKNYKP